MDTETPHSTPPSTISSSTAGSPPATPKSSSRPAINAPPPSPLALETTPTDQPHSLTNAELRAQITNLHAQLAASQHAYNCQQDHLRTAQELHTRLEQWGTHVAYHAEVVSSQVERLTGRINTLGRMVYDREVQIEKHKDREERYAGKLRAERARTQALKVKREELEEKVEDLERRRVVWEFGSSMHELSRESRG